MKLPKFGIVTPTYNQGIFIERTIKSILDQNYPNLEYWIIDGGSTDDTVSVLKKYGKKINWISEKDNGQADAINKGLKRICDADIYAYLNSDDTYNPGALWDVAECFNKNGSDWITGSYRIIDENDRPITNQQFIVKYKEFFLRHYSPFVLKVTNSTIPQPSTFWSKKAFHKIGLFDTSRKYIMEYDYWLSLSEHFPLTYIDKSLSNFRIHTTSITNNNHSFLLNEELRVLEKHHVSKFELIAHKAHTLLASGVYSFLKK